MFIREVAKDILMLKFKSSMTLKQIENIFYKIMRKHGIKYGTKNPDGSVTVANPEWSMAMCLFMDKVESHFRLLGIIGKVPKDLEY